MHMDSGLRLMSGSQRALHKNKSNAEAKRIRVEFLEEVVP